MNQSPLALHLPDADSLTGQEIGAVLELKPAAMLCLTYAQWDTDVKDGKPGVSQQVSDLVLSLRHDRLYVRFHADPNPPAYARSIGGPEAWGELCASRMSQYYGSLGASGVELHAILANEVDAASEGDLPPGAASDFYRRALNAYTRRRPQDTLHVPATTGAPQTHREYLERYRADGWLDDHPEYYVDGHGYDGDLENVLNVLHEVCPDHHYVITETNDLDDFSWPINLLAQGKANDIVYFTLNWARGGIGRVQPPSADDAAKRMSLMRFPDRYQQFKATIAATASPPPVVVPDPPPPEEPPMPETSQGIDVSNNNGHVDWDAVAAAGIEWAYAKVSEGAGFIDRFFPENWAAMKARGIVRGAYDFTRPTQTSAEAEARFFLDCLEAAGGLDVGDFIVCDWEDEHAIGDYGAWLLNWLQYVEARVGFKPMVYTGAWVIAQTNLAAYPALAEYGLILAAYQGTPPATPAPWTLMAGWQNADTTGVPGVTGDHDVFFGSVEQLRKYGKPASTEPSEPPATNYSVGPGVLAAMAEHGEQPGSSEVYPNPFWSETMSTSGTTYKWLKANGQTFRYPAG